MSRFAGGEKIQSGDKEWKILGTDSIVFYFKELVMLR